MACRGFTIGYKKGGGTEKPEERTGQPVRCKIACGRMSCVGANSAEAAKCQGDGLELRRAAKQCERAHQSVERQRENGSWCYSGNGGAMRCRCWLNLWCDATLRLDLPAGGRVSEAKWEKRWAQYCGQVKSCQVG